MPTTAEITKTHRDGLQRIRNAHLDISMRLTEGEISKDQATRQRDRLRREARTLDAEARAQFAEAINDADAEARARRAEWAANHNPLAKYASEYPALMASPRDGAGFAEQAEWMLNNSQPERAAFLAQVAAEKGARVDPTLTARIDNALDASDTLRAEARGTGGRERRRG